MNASSAREQILKRIRGANVGAAKWNSATTAGKAAEVAGVPRDYIRRGSLDPDACVTKMIERLREYDAEVTECAPEELPMEIQAQIARSGRSTLVAPAGVPQEWLTPSCDWKIDDDLSGNLSIAEIEHSDGVLTACFCGVADSGTIVLHHLPAEGRRVITLLPDWHLCILHASQIVETLPEYFDRCRGAGNEKAGSKGASHPSEQESLTGGPGREQGNEGAREQGNEKAGAGDLAMEKPPALVTWISGPSATADIEMTRIKGVHGPRFLNVIVVRDQALGTRQ